MSQIMFHSIRCTGYATKIFNNSYIVLGFTSFNILPHINIMDLLNK